MKNQKTIPKDGAFNFPGLTKREYFAALAMQSTVAHIKQVDPSNAGDMPAKIAAWSVKFADELIKALNDETTEDGHGKKE